MKRPSRIHALVVLACLALLPLGCLGGAWKQALKEDSPAAYYRFLRDHPDSRYSEDAKARLEFHKVKRRPSLAAFGEFREKFPESPLLDELRPMLEQKAFELARGAGTAQAYDEFLEQFPSGPLAARAEGNAVYLRERGFGGRPGDLGAFAEAHPESDFAAEARRSADSVQLRSQTGFGRVGLRVEISPSTPEVNRLIASFTEKATEQYEDTGIELVPLTGLKPADGGAPQALLRIQHAEQKVETQIASDRMSRPGFEGVTRVTLQVGQEGAPVWEQEYRIRLEPGEHLAKTSVLYSPSGRRFWKSFFVPVATWQSKGAVRSVLQLAKKVTAVDAVGDRAVVLFEDGDFQLIALADPASPVVLAQHERARDFKKWNGVRALGNRVALFGEDGMEIVRFTSEGSETVAVLERGTIGSVVAVEPVGDSLVLGTNRGIIVSDADAARPARLLRRDIQGLAAVGDTLVFADGESVLVSSVPLLRQNRVMAQLRLGRDFGPGRVRAFGEIAVVIGANGVLVMSVRDPSKPKVISQLYSQKIGRISDASRVGDRIFLLGERGLLVLDRSGRKVAESIDVDTRDRLAAMGRHMVAVGESELQVVDATPFTQTLGAQPTGPSPAATTP